MFVGVNGHSQNGEIDDFVIELNGIKSRWELPWCIRGDFNLVRFPKDQKGGCSRDNKMIKFGDFLDRWHLIDGPLKGTKFTWSNFQILVSLSGLNHFLFYVDWENFFVDRVQTALPLLTSYRNLILLEGKCLLGDLALSLSWVGFHGDGGKRME